MFHWKIHYCDNNSRIIFSIPEDKTMFSKMSELRHHIFEMVRSFEEVDISKTVERQETDSNTGKVDYQILFKVCF